MTDQLTLEDIARRHHLLHPGRDIQARFEEWMGTRDGRLVYGELVRRALLLRRRGWRHYSHKAILETIRYDASIEAGPEAGYKINDHYASRLVRKVMDEQPELRGFFETRELRA